MSKTVIKVEKLSKKYIIGHKNEGLSRYVALRDVMVEGVTSAARKILNPFGKGNDRSIEEFWALKDVSFEVQEGDRVGIIGRNGAGKSTLLKVLSRITEPSIGRVSIRGRVASLLEVGTGFHPELTGRENLYLSGAILGMTRLEINKKFDEIVEFAEVERFLDTPVKRYSSGMYVKLAFAVSAHLEPDILLVDEVLAVGDTQFQKKCLGKMKDVGKQGRTVLFVSHNMAVINKLCNFTILLNKGSIHSIGETSSVTARYLEIGSDSLSEKTWPGGTGDETIKLFAVRLKNSKDELITSTTMQEEFYVEADYKVYKQCEAVRVAFRLNTFEGVTVLTSCDLDDVVKINEKQPGSYRTRARIPANFLNEGRYDLTFALYIPFVKEIFIEDNCLSINVEHTGGIGGYVQDGRKGIVRVLLDWETDLLPGNIN